MAKSFLVTLFYVFMVVNAWITCEAVIPTAELEVHVSGTARTLSSYTIFASQASFGGTLPMSNREASDKEGEWPSLRLLKAPTDNADMCEKPTAATIEQNGSTGTVLLIPRGTCTFETKAYHAQLFGARAIIVYGSLESRYSLNSTAHNTNTTTVPNQDDIVWPVPLQDYDCDKGRALIPKSSIQLQPLPYNAEHNNPLLSGSSRQNMCLEKSPNALETCDSKACLLTGKEEFEYYEACCAWDLYVWLYEDALVFHSINTTKDLVVTIPAVYVKLSDGLELLHDLEMAGDSGNVFIKMSERWRPLYNPSSALIWCLAVIVAAVASHLSAKDYYDKIRRVLREKEQAERGESTSLQQEQEQQAPRTTQVAQPEETLELNAWHSLAFLVMASTSLLILFYFKIFGFVKVMYALGCSKAVSVILLTPLLTRIIKKGGIANRTVCRIQWEDIGDITLVDIMAHVIGYTLGLVWLVLAFVYYHPENITFFWVMQDIFGACMCVLFLQVVKLNNIRVATILLVVAFFYDIFFVFISPLIFKKSVMIDVATSGGPPPNPEWCEKYPDDPENCQQRGNPLPMLFTIPRISDYQGGQNLLGLGDVVVPGLLISFAARFDAAKSLLGVMGGGNGSLGSYACPERRFCGSMCWNGGYFVPVVIAYGVGLSMANAAVYLMEMGQPALLYLVPCCLGVMLLIGWWRKDLNELWNGPRALRAADVICYGEQTAANNGAPSLPVPQDGRGEMESLTVPSAVDENENL